MSTGITMAPSRSIIGEVMTAARTQRMFSRRRRRAVWRNLAISKFLHAEGFDHAISSDGFLKNLAEIAEAGLTIFRRTANLAAELVDRQDDHGQEHDGAERHSPVQAEHHGDEDKESKTFAKKIGQVLGKRDARALDVVDGYGKEAARRMVLKKTNWLANEPGVYGVAQIGDRGVAHKLNLRGA